MDNQKAKMLGENLAHYKRMQENGTVDIIEFHTTDGQKFGIGNVAAIQLLLSVTVTELERQLHTAHRQGSSQSRTATGTCSLCRHINNRTPRQL